MNCIIVRNEEIPCTKKFSGYSAKKGENEGGRKERKRRTPLVTVDDTCTRHCHMHNLFRFLGIFYTWNISESQTLHLLNLERYNKDYPQTEEADRVAVLVWTVEDPWFRLQYLNKQKQQNQMRMNFGLEK